MTITLNQALTIYNWFLSAILIVILLMIARIYERKTNIATYYRIFILPLTLFGLASIRTAYLDQSRPDEFATGLGVVAGVVLAALSIRLYEVMISHH